MNGISTLIKESTRSSFASPSHGKTQQEGEERVTAHSKKATVPEPGAPQHSPTRRHLDLGLPASRTGRSRCVVHKQPIYGIPSQLPEQTKTTTVFNCLMSPVDFNDCAHPTQAPFEGTLPIKAERSCSQTP